MKRAIRTFIMVLLLAVFVFSAGMLAVIRTRYRTSEKIYEDAAVQFTEVSLDSIPKENGGNGPSIDNGAQIPSTEGQTAGAEALTGDLPPIKVDFEALTALNPDVIGWIYCPFTVINYPVVQGPDNDYYLERSCNKKPDPSGTIFSDSSNSPGFEDSNVILYGHHMQNMTMFATLKYWAEQEYYDEHPFMWLLTPERDYKVELFSVYTASAFSEAFTISHEPGPAFDSYLELAASKSMFECDVDLDGNAKYIMMSTCAYSFDYARTVLHGKLVPLDSAGGKPLSETSDAAAAQ